MIKDSEAGWKNFPLIGVKGLNTFDDASAIDDLALSGAKNMIFDGFLQPRSGSELLFERPAAETGDPLELMTAKTSDGIEYTIVIYGNHFYLYHEGNNELVRINMTYIPSQTDLDYGWVNWNNGRGDDRLYFCNGTDHFGRWDMCVSAVNGLQPAGSTTLAIADSTRFPATGTVVIKGSSGEFTAAYTANSGNVLTLTTPLSQDAPANASVASDIVEKPGMELGKVVKKWSSRLIVMNYYGGETVLWYSVLSNPESFATGSDIVDAGTETISDGNGQITGGHDFGLFFVIEKEDSVHTFSFQISDDLGSKLTVITPIASGTSFGPIGDESTIKVLNMLYYPTRAEGFMSLEPSSTGGQTSVAPTIISRDVQNFVKKMASYESCRGAFFDQKLLWAVTIPGGDKNTFVITYDLLQKAWGVIYGWAVMDWANKGDTLLYLDGGNGSVYRALNGSYNDNNNPYACEAFTKRFDFGALSMPKTSDALYVQGFLTPASEFFADVLYNEGGVLKTQTYKINKDTPNLYFSQPLTDAQGQFVQGQPPMGGVILSEIGDVSFFRCYLGISNRIGYFNIQVRFYSNKAAFWGITGAGILPVLAHTTPSEMYISPVVAS